MFFSLKILKINLLSKHVREIVVEKPEGYEYFPGQHAIVTINNSNLEKIKRLYTIASFPQEENLKFIIKSYLDRNGLSKEFENLKEGDSLLVSKAKGKFGYHGKGVFIASGTGIVPFFSITNFLKFKKNEDKNILFFSVKSKGEVFLEKEIKELFKGGVNITLTQEKDKNYFFGRIDKNLLQSELKDLNQNFYICGTIEFIRSMKEILRNLGVSEEVIYSELG